MHGQQIIKTLYFVSDGVSVHHQELKTVHTASCIGLTKPDAVRAVLSS